MSEPSKSIPEISVCIITFKRPVMLGGLLTAINRLATDGLFKVSVVVVDNDREQSAREAVASARATSAVPIAYDVESEQNLSLARNRSVRVATGEYVAFIDDDEVPPPSWLTRMFRTLVQHNVDGVLGPVFPQYESDPPEWLIKSKVAERPEHKTGEVLNWGQTRTGNVLLKRAVFEGPDNQFDPVFASHGEDRDFFRRVMAQGRRFVWCAEAAVPEIQPADRVRRKYFLQRALLRGSVSWRQRPSPGLLFRTAAAISLYACALPVMLLGGQGLFMRYLVKSCDHAGRLMCACGLNVEKCLKKFG